MNAYDLIDQLPAGQRLVAATAFEVLRLSAPSEQYEIARATTCVAFLEAFGVAGAERLVSRWSSEGVPA